MRSNELRIGNIVCLIDRRPEVHLTAEYNPYVASEIGAFHVKLYPLNGNPVERKHIESDLSPIPLTEEWLLKFGFNNDYRNGYIGIDVNQSDFVLTKPKVMGDWQNSFCFQFEAGGIHKFKEIKHVHQLQNLYFCLAGEELTIKQTESI